MCVTVVSTCLAVWWSASRGQNPRWKKIYTVYNIDRDSAPINTLWVEMDFSSSLCGRPRRASKSKKCSVYRCCIRVTWGMTIHQRKWLLLRPTGRAAAAAVDFYRTWHNISLGGVDAIHRGDQQIWFFFFYVTNFFFLDNTMPFNVYIFL